MIVGTFAKTPDEVKDFTIDWSLDLATGEVISSSTITPPSGITVPANSFSDSLVTLSISGGMLGEKYDIVNTIVTSRSNVLDASILVRVSYLALGDNTLCELDPADNYHALAQNTTWMAYNVSAREGYLVRATRILNRQRWLGEKYDSAQALVWPRSGTGVDGVEDDAVPQAIQDACAELALMIGSGSYDVENDANQAQKLQSIKAGSVGLTYFRGAEGRPHRFPLIVNELLRDYLAGGDLSIGMTATGTDGVSSTEDDFGHAEGL